LNTALGTPTTGRSGGVSAGTGMVYVPAEIKQRTSAAITNAQVQETNRMIAEARPAIENVVGLAACGADPKRMAQYTDPSDTSYSFWSPLNSMSYHKSGCVSPVRVAGWQKRSANAISFIVDYVSPQSEEGTRRNYTAIKQPSGEWLFR
ncbi:hypothetical protein, partial [Paraburkholderia azotifigens]